MKATPQKLVWAEGMFLSPQHFQALDGYYETLLEARLGAVNRVTWGVATLEIDAAALASGQLRLQRFAGIFPDGLAVAFGESDAEAPAPRSVQERFPATARSIDVFLAVRREREGIPAYAEARGETNAARYAVTSRPVHDSTRAGGLVDVSFARPRTTLLLGDESREDYETIQIAEIVRTGTGQLALSDTFVAPILRLAAAPKVASSVRDLVVRLVAKHRELADGRRHRDGGGAEINGPELARILQIFALGEAIPALADLVEGQEGSALDTYRVLARLAGQLATFTVEADVAGLPKYVHADLRSTFEPLLTRLHAYVGGMAVERFTRVPLEVRGALQIARLADENMVRMSQLFLSVKSDIPEAQVAEQLPRLCKIAALGEIQSLVQAAAPGIPLQLMHRPPPEIPVRPGVLCFAITQSDRLWKNVVTDRNLALYLPPPFDPSRTKVELLAVAGRPAGAAAAS